MKITSLILAIISALLFVYCLYTLDLNSEKWVGQILQTVVFAINGAVFFMHWRRLSKQSD